MTSAGIKSTLLELAREIDERKKGARELAVGREVRIVKDWRDQPVGSSKPNQRGKVFRVREAFYWSEGWFFLIGDFRCGIDLDMVEFVEDEGEPAR